MSALDHDALDIAYHAAIAPEYDAVVVAPRQVANDILFATFDPLVRPGRAMLDLGCGTGHMLLRYGGRYRERIGVDHSPAMLAQARAHLDAAGLADTRLVQESLLPFLERMHERFQLVTCTGCLHHLELHVAVELLTRVAGLLAEDGVFVMAEPIEVDIATMPREVQEWNARSIAPTLRYSREIEDPDEAPLPLAAFEASLMKAGLRIAATSRGWELFPLANPPSLSDHLGIWRLHHEHGASGNVFAALAVRA